MATMYFIKQLGAFESPISPLFHSETVSSPKGPKSFKTMLKKMSHEFLQPAKMVLES
jgi:hypothetical protein